MSEVPTQVIGRMVRLEHIHGSFIFGMWVTLQQKFLVFGGFVIFGEIQKSGLENFYMHLCVLVII